MPRTLQCRTSGQKKTRITKPVSPNRRDDLVGARAFQPREPVIPPHGYNFNSFNPVRS